MNTRLEKRTNHASIRIIIPCLITVAVISIIYLLFFGPLSWILNFNKPLQIKIGQSKYDYPPLHYYDNDKVHVGFDVELAQAVADIIGAEIEFVPIDWSNSVEMLESGEVDVLWGGLERASLDERKVQFTKSYLRSNIVLLMTTDRDYSKWEDLQGLNVCALNFTPAYSYFKVYDRDVIKSRRSFTPPEYQSLYNSLSSSEYDCMITDTCFASFFLSSSSGNTYKVSDTIIGSNYAVGVRADDTDLFERIQNALDELQADGTIDRLREKWIGN